MSDKIHNGKLDFSNYIAIGDSLTAGYADSSLYRSGQESSFPSFLATQFGCPNFRTPFLKDDNGWPELKMVLSHQCNCITGDIELAPTIAEGIPIKANEQNIGLQEGYHNMGIPRLRVIDIGIPGYPFFNPYAKRMLTPTQQSFSLLEIYKNLNPSFFTLWLGSNDLLLYAVNGGMGQASGCNMDDISPVKNFEINYNLLVDTLTQNGAKGVLVTLPDVDDTPLFNVIPYDGLLLDKPKEVAELNNQYNAYGIHFTIGKNPFIIADSNAKNGFRQMKKGEMIIKDVCRYIQCQALGSKIPIPDHAVLTRQKLAHLSLATQAFNEIIITAANRKNLALYDARRNLKTLRYDMRWNGDSRSIQYARKGIFSLDGVHLSQKGYAVVANGIIKTINKKYHTSIAMVDSDKYCGVQFP